MAGVAHGEEIKFAVIAEKFAIAPRNTRLLTGDLVIKLTVKDLPWQQ